jgi:Predicted coiled-coil domain-containing protein.
LSKSAVSLSKDSRRSRRGETCRQGRRKPLDAQGKLDAIDTKGLNENLMQTAESMNKLTQNVDAMVYRNQDQVGNAVEELNTILENLEEFTQKIKNNPSVLIRSEGKSGR